MKTTADVVIIGAGIQGTSVAYHLTRKGVTNVLVVEMDQIGSGSSSRSAAQLWSQFPEALNIILSLESFKEYQRFREELGVDIGLTITGTLLLASESNVNELRAQIEVQRKLGVLTEVLSPEDLGRLIPGLNVDDVIFGALCRQDGFIDPHSVMQAYSRAASRLGAEFNEGVRATGIIQNGSRIVAVDTSGGPIYTPVVVNAAGVLAAEVGRWLGIELPIRNSKRHLFITEPFSDMPNEVPMVEDDSQWYFRREGPGVMMGMGLEWTDEIAPQTNWGFLEQVVDHALYRFPPLCAAKVSRGWAGIRPLTPDNLPILGRIPEVSGYINCCGWGGQGVMHAPIGGRLIAELIADGTPVSIDLSPLSSQRF